MIPLNSFLKAAKLQFSKNLLHLEKVTIVAGNQSCDLDSVVSAISYSYLHSLNNNDLILPLLNIPKEDLLLRKDIEFVINSTNIDSNDLLYLNDISDSELLSNSNIKIQLVLVDHNDVQGDLIKNHLLTKTNCEIISIMDHHDDERKFLDATPRIIERSGSCNTLVLTHFQNELFNFKEDLPLLKFFISPILIDTSNLQFRVEPKDKYIYKYLSDLNSSFLGSIEPFYHQIKFEKNNIEGLSLRDILRKDYKEFKFGNFSVGISSVVKSLDYLNKFQQLSSKLNDWKLERSLDLVVIMTSFESNCEFKRQLAFYGNDQLSDSVLTLITSDLQLSKLESSSEDLLAFSQNNIQASRKQVAPLLKLHIEAL